MKLAPSPEMNWSSAHCRSWSILCAYHVVTCDVVVGLHNANSSLNILAHIHIEQTGVVTTQDCNYVATNHRSEL